MCVKCNFSFQQLLLNTKRIFSLFFFVVSSVFNRKETNSWFQTMQKLSIVFIVGSRIFSHFSSHPQEQKRLYVRKYTQTSIVLAFLLNCYSLRICTSIHVTEKIYYEKLKISNHIRKTACKMNIIYEFLCPIEVCKKMLFILVIPPNTLSQIKIQ